MRTTAQLYPGRDTFEFDQAHVTKNQPITVVLSLIESLAIEQLHLIVLLIKSSGSLWSLGHPGIRR